MEPILALATEPVAPKRSPAPRPETNQDRASEPARRDSFADVVAEQDRASERPADPADADNDNRTDTRRDNRARAEAPAPAEPTDAKTADTPDALTIAVPQVEQTVAPTVIDAETAAAAPQVDAAVSETAATDVPNTDRSAEGVVPQTAPSEVDATAANTIDPIPSTAPDAAETPSALGTPLQEFADPATSQDTPVKAPALPTQTATTGDDAAADTPVETIQRTASAAETAVEETLETTAPSTNAAPIAAPAAAVANAETPAPTTGDNASADAIDVAAEAAVETPTRQGLDTDAGGAGQGQGQGQEAGRAAAGPNAAGAQAFALGPATASAATPLEALAQEPLPTPSGDLEADAEALAARLASAPTPTDQSRQAAAPVIAAIRGREGAQTLEIRLDPPELGRVEIDLSFDGDRVVVAVRADRDDALDLMRRHGLDFLKELEASGLDVGDMSFERRDGQSDGGGQRAADAWGEADARAIVDPRAAGGLTPERLQALAPRLPTGAETRLDLRV